MEKGSLRFGAQRWLGLTCAAVWLLLGLWELWDRLAMRLPWLTEGAMTLAVMPFKGLSNYLHACMYGEHCLLNMTAGWVTMAVAWAVALAVINYTDSTGANARQALRKEVLNPTGIALWLLLAPVYCPLVILIDCLDKHPNKN